MFAHWLPGEYSNKRWPTHDRVIPWKLFEVRSRVVFAVMAQERVQIVRAIGSVMTKSAADGQRIRQNDIDEAFPGARNGTKA